MKQEINSLRETLTYLQFRLNSMMTDLQEFHYVLRATCSAVDSLKIRKVSTSKRSRSSRKLAGKVLYEEKA